MSQRQRSYDSPAKYVEEHRYVQQKSIFKDSFHFTDAHSGIKRLSKARKNLLFFLDTPSARGFQQCLLNLHLNSLRRSALGVLRYTF